MMFSIVIRGGRVVDGSGNPWFRGDVGIERDTITAVGHLGDADAQQVIDASNHVVCPGFIDVHSHSDWTLLANLDCESSIRQGATTEIVGNCGMSYAPVTDRSRVALERRSNAFQPGVDIDWETFGQYLDRIEQGKVATNIGCQVGHGTIRRAAMGTENRPATADELRRMEALLREAFEAGAAGFSTGLEFMPGRCADTSELVELAKVAAEYGRPHASHIRNRDLHFERSVEEALEITRQSGSKLQLSHLSPKPGSPEGSWWRITERVEEARREGLDVTADMIPYDTGMGLVTAILPAWVTEGGIAKTIEILKDPTMRPRLKKECDRYWLLMAQGKWDRVFLSSSEKHPELVGRSFAQIGGIMGQDPFDSVFDILVDEGEGMNVVTMNGHLFSEQDMQDMISHRLFAIASDGWTASATGPTAKMANHPACFDWTATALVKYVREANLLGLEDAVRKMTSFPAAIYGIRDRGILREAMRADIVVFDPDRIQNNATFTEPRRYPTGINYVLVNGSLKIKGGQLIPGRTGELLRRW